MRRTLEVAGGRLLGSNHGLHCLRNEVLRRPAESAEPPDGGRASLPQFLHAALGLRLSFRRVSFRQQTYSEKHAYLNFADEEVFTVSLFGLIRERETIKEIHEYAEDHFSEG
jgi:hypothetical protein